MEITIALFVMGVLIGVVSIWRARNIFKYSRLRGDIEREFDASDLDLSGKVKYANCYSHKWVMENIAIGSQGGFVNFIRSRMESNTLMTYIWLSLILGCAGLLIGLLTIVSIRSLGGAVGVIFIGLMIILGPDDPKSSEELLDELRRVDFSELEKEDFVYASLAFKSVRNWFVISLLIGLGFAAISPWGEMIPAVIAAAVGIFAQYVLWNPATFLNEISAAYVVLYLAFAIAFFLMILPKMIIEIIKNIREKSEEDNF